MKRILTRLSSAAVLAALSACASYPAPVQQLADAEAASRTAQESGASDDPQGQLHLQLAQEEIAQAKQLMAAGDNELATSKLARARSDAELALEQARTNKASADARRALAHVQQLESNGPATTTTTTSVTTTGAQVPAVAPPVIVPPAPPPASTTTTTTTTQKQGGTP
jgi:hypothetical protein